MITSNLVTNYPELENILKEIPSYAAEHCTIKKLKPSSYILRKGDHSENVYLLLEGIVDITNEFEAGDCFCFAQTKAIDILGEIEFLANEDMIASTCRTSTHCTFLQIPLSIMEKWINDDIKFFNFISKALAKKSYEASYYRGMEMVYPAIDLLKYYILRHLEPYIENEPSTYLNKNRDTISEELGISVRSVNRAIQKLKLESLVSIEKGKIHMTKTQYSVMHDSLTQKC
jgi:CRP/FNR family transcriptional regulator, cyclic AMP receptor protein